MMAPYKINFAYIPQYSKPLISFIKNNKRERI